MFEKISKYFANRAADGAVEGVKTSLNEKFDQYGDIIRIGLVLSVIILGGRHITKSGSMNRARGYDPARLPQAGQPYPPIVINNYYPDYSRQQLNERRERRAYGNYINQSRQINRRH